jgi:hypothetical protein
MIIFSLVILRSWFSIRTLMFSFWNFSTHVGNTLLVDDIPYKSIFNDSCGAIFLELFEGAGSDGDYLLSIVLPYLVSFHFFGFSVQIYLKHNPFGTIKNISQLKIVMIVVMQCTIQKQN